MLVRREVGTRPGGYVVTDNDSRTYRDSGQTLTLNGSVTQKPVTQPIQNTGNGASMTCMGT